MSGLQEILVIVLLFVLIFFLPRRLGKGGSKKAGGMLQTLSGRLRLAMVVSVVWLLAWAAYFRPWSGGLLGFALVGLGPVVLGWGILWVLDGFKKKRDV